MTALFILLLAVTLVNSEDASSGTNCNNYQANFNLKDVIGTWQVVAIIPGKLYPEKQITCYRTELTESDAGGLRWLINKTLPEQHTFSHEDDGIIVRQRYHTETPYDVWSKSIHGVSGCFQKLVALDDGKQDTEEALRRDAIMQFHLLEVTGSQPFLLQMIWGRMIAVIIYRRNQGVTQDELKPVIELINKIGGKQRLPKICDTPLQKL